MKDPISAETFSAYMRQDTPVLVEFYAPWCSYCRRIEPAVSRLIRQYDGRLTIVAVNIDEEPALADKERIELVPTFVLYRDGAAQADLVAPQSYEQLEQLVLAFL